MRHLVDSDYLVDALVGVPASVRVLERLSDEELGVSIVSYGEIFEGAFGASDPTARLERFRTFLGRFAVVPLSDPIMEIFARTRKRLRDTGLLIPDLDLLIGATAVHHDLTLLTRNVRYFGRIRGLKMYQPN